MLDNLSEAIKTMSHPVFSLEELGESIAQGLPVSRHRDDGGVPELIINVKDLDNLYIENEVEKVHLNSPANIHRYRLRKNDVVIAIRGSLLKSSVVTKASEGSIAGQNVAFLRPRNLNQVNPAYIAVLMRSKWIDKVYTLTKRSSTTLPSIRVSELRELKIPLPEIDTQNKIVQLFLSCERYKELTLAALLARQELTEMVLSQLLEK